MLVLLVMMVLVLRSACFSASTTCVSVSTNCNGASTTCNGSSITCIIGSSTTCNDSASVSASVVASTSCDDGGTSCGIFPWIRSLSRELNTHTPSPVITFTAISFQNTQPYALTF